MAERVRYRTKQQELIRECLKKHSGRFLTAEQCMDCLKADGLHVGQTTVYRALDRLTEQREVIKIPAVDGASAQFRYVGELKPGSRAAGVPYVRKDDTAGMQAAGRVFGAYPGRA